MKKNRKLLDVFEGQMVRPPPIWLMRQAGRYLPEYRALREKGGSFWGLSMNPELAAEATLQPVRRFGFDAAIIFSDILVVPMAFGIDVRIEEGLGPRLPQIRNTDALVEDASCWDEKLTPVYEALARVRRELPDETALIGFAGAPWTLATYLAEGQGSPDQRAAKLWGYRDPIGLTRLLDKLVDGIARHLVAQLQSGADVVQIFDSWAGGLPAKAFDDWVVKPTRKIVEKVRREHPTARIIGFPRATTLEGYRFYAELTGVDAVSIDTAAPIGWAAQTVGTRKVIQGNLDPIALIAGGAALDDAVDSILKATERTPFIFNLGHGILPETPIANVERLVQRVRGR